MSGSKVISCTCSNDQQDKIHGKGRRVHNRMKAAKGSTPGYRCTSCSKVK